MNAQVLWRAAPVVLFLTVMLLPMTPCAAGGRARRVNKNAVQVELFSAIQKKQIEVTLIPRDSKRATIQVKNNTGQPLVVNMPPAVAAVPVLAQFQQGNRNFGLGNGFQNGPFAANRNQGAQALGVGIPNGQGRNNGNGNNIFPGGQFNVPPRKIVKAKLPCVCLEHGKPEPRPKIPYEIKPLENFTDQAEVHELLALLAQGRYAQRVAQLAAWHLANDMSWDKLSKLQIKHLDGRSERQFTAAQIKQAKKMVLQLPSRSEQPPGQSLSLSRR